MKPLTEKSVALVEYLQANNGVNKTSADIAKDLGIADKRSIEGTATSLQKKGLVTRVAAQVKVVDADGNEKWKDVNFIQCTPAGLAFRHGVDDVDAE